MKRRKKDFWKSVKAIFDQQRRLPRELRMMSGVPIEPFHVDRLPPRKAQG